MNDDRNRPRSADGSAIVVGVLFVLFGSSPSAASFFTVSFFRQNMTVTEMSETSADG